MELRRQERLAYIKIVYCGPPGAGKSTNIGWLHREAKGGRGELLTAPLGRDRMLWFDFEPLQPTAFRDFQIRYLIATVPGAVASGATRKHVLRGVDGVVFVADSTASRLYETLSAYRETTHSIDAPLESSAVPIVLQYNKRDLERPLSRLELDEGLNSHRQPVFDAVATRGEGVLETFRAALQETLGSIAPHNEGLQLLRGMSISEHTDALVKKLFGRASFYEPVATPAPEPEAPPAPVAQAAPTQIFHDIATEPVTGKLSLVTFEAALADAQVKAAAAPPAPEVGAAPAASPPAPPAPAQVPDAESSPAASPAPAPDAESSPAALPAPASDAESSTAASPAPAPASPAPASPAPAPVSPPSHAERYEDLRQAIEAARALALGAQIEATLGPVLSRLVSATSAFTASVLLPAPGGVSVAASHPLNGDPIARRPQAGRLVATLGRGSEAKAHEPSGNPALADALRGQSLGTVVSAPLRSPRGLHGVLLLYLLEDAEPMDSALLDHVGAVASALTLAMGGR